MDKNFPYNDSTNTTFNHNLQTSVTSSSPVWKVADESILPSEVLENLEISWRVMSDRRRLCWPMSLVTGCDYHRWCEIIHTFKSSWVGPLQIWGDLDLHPGVEFERDKYNICLRYVNLISMCLVIYGHRSSSFVMEWVWGQFYLMPQNTAWIGKLQIPSLRSSMRNKCHFINICFPLWLLGLH